LRNTRKQETTQNNKTVSFQLKNLCNPIPESKNPKMLARTLEPSGGGIGIILNYGQNQIKLAVWTNNFEQ